MAHGAKSIVLDRIYWIYEIASEYIGQRAERIAQRAKSIVKVLGFGLVKRRAQRAWRMAQREIS